MSEPKLLLGFTKMTLVSVSANPKLYFQGDQPPRASLNDLHSASNDGTSRYSPKLPIGREKYRGGDREDRTRSDYLQYSSRSTPS